MNLGDLGDSLLNLGKEKAKEMADQALGERAEGGDIAGSVAGFSKDMLDNALGGNEQDNAGSGEAEEGGAEADDNSSDDSSDNDADAGDKSSEDDSNDGDNSDDENK